MNGRCVIGSFTGQAEHMSDNRRQPAETGGLSEIGLSWV